MITYSVIYSCTCGRGMLERAMEKRTPKLFEAKFGLKLHYYNNYIFVIELCNHFRMFD